MSSFGKEIQKGRQVYVVYPLIEGNEKLDYKDLEAGLETGLQVFIIQFLISFNQRIYHINLTPLLYLFPKELIQLRLFIIIAMKRLYRFTSRR